MANRGFGTQTIGSAARPVFGTVLAAALTPTPDPRTGNFNPASQSSTCIGTVTTQVLRKGDRVLVGTAAAITAGTSDSAKIMAVSGTTVTFQGLTSSHASGEIVVLCLPAAAINIQVLSTAAGLYIGEDSTAGPSSLTLIQIISGGATNWGQSAVGNVFETQHLWIEGTSGDTYLPSVVTI